MAPPSLILHSPAKINLGLHVLGKRPDGYHEVRTILQKLDLRDRVTLTLRPRGIRVRCSHPDVPDGASNLAFRAAERLLRRAGSRAGCSVYIDKRIPVEAGLGGGSSNAAAVLYGLNRLLGLEISPPDLRDLAAGIGVDVPFFLGGPCELGEDRGDRLTGLEPGPPRPVVLVTPPFPVSAGWAYGALNCGLTRQFAKSKITIPASLLSWLPKGWDVLRNDLEGPVMDAHPVLGDIKGRLRELGAEFALMSGSGPTVFGWFRDLRRARRAVRTISDIGLDCRLTRTLGMRDKLF